MYFQQVLIPEPKEFSIWLFSSKHFQVATSQNKSTATEQALNSELLCMLAYHIEINRDIAGPPIT
jgi:hypothetical protein